MEITATIVYEKNWNAIHAVDENGNFVYRYIINEGSSRSSKTVSIIDVYDNYARENENKRMTVWRDTKTDCKKTVLNDALKHFKKTGRYGVDQTFNKTESIFTYDDGSTFEIHGTDDEETVHGLTQDCAWINEPYKISKDTFDQIDQRTSDFIIIDWNPKKAHWIEDLKKDPRTIVIHSTFKDNPFCPIEQKRKILSYQPVKFCDIVISGVLSESTAKEYDILSNKLCFTPKQLKELSRCRENEHKNSADEFKWQVYGLGLKAERPNRIFKFNEISLDHYLSISTTIYNGVDWGAVDPWGILEVKYYDGALYVRELNYTCENTIRTKLTETERAQLEGSEEGIVSWMFSRLSINQDNMVICDNNRKAKILALRDSGWEYAIAASKLPGSVVDGIDLLNDIKVYFTSCSANFKHEQENYSRKVDRYGIVLEEPEDTDNHLMDPLRYIAIYLQEQGIIRV
jgi:phage terminase large subunit